ncbi:MAG: thioesterase family protein [Dongiaceae bacterium]
MTANLAEFETPFVVEGMTVLPEWTDYNGHYNIAYYLVAFDKAFDLIYEKLGFALDQIQTKGVSTFSTEHHLTYQREMVVGDPIRIEAQLIECDAKRFRVFYTMYHATEGYLAATDERIDIYVDMKTRRVIPFPDSVRDHLARLKAAHDRLGMPFEAGRGIDFSNKRRPD